MPLWILSLILSCMTFGLPSTEAPPKVVLQQGTYIGFASGLKGKTFLNIPYATPPLGVLRFQHPKPIQIDSNSSHNIFYANAWGNSCWGRKTLSPDFTRMSEDCLNLNIFVPNSNSEDQEKLPVIVWVFGSAFNQGNDQGAVIRHPIDYSLYDGQRIINVDNRAIIVTFNYRVNVFGFLSGNAVQDLNPGLMDQVAAFQWIKENINAFGGDPNQITAIGCSAGAITIGALMLANNGEQKLFDRAILLSGPAPFALPSRDLNQKPFETIAKNVGCNPKDEKVMECLHSVEPSLLIDASDKVTFYLTADGSFLKHNILQSFAASNFSKIPLLVNTDEDEGTTFFSDLITLLGPENVTDDSLLPLQRYFTGGFLKDAEILLANENYSSKSTKISSQAIFTEFFADWQFKCPASKMAAMYADAGVETYVSLFTHVPTYFKYLAKHERAFHGSDVLFFWQVKPLLFPAEWELADRITHAYIDFALGNRPVASWKPFNLSRPTVFNIDSLKSSLDPNPHRNLCKLFYAALDDPSKS